MAVLPGKPSWAERLTGLPTPWSRPVLMLMVGAIIAMVAVFSSAWQSTHALLVGLLIAVVWIATGLADAMQVLHRELSVRKPTR